MPRKRVRKENAGLPKHWRKRHGAYYYDVPEHLRDQWDWKREFRLGKTLVEAYRAWSERLDLNENAKSIGQLLERYALEVMPEKAPKTQESNFIAIKRLTAVFGHMPITALEPQHAYQYIDKRSKEAATAAIREYEVLSHAFTMTIKWGYIRRPPIERTSRKRAPETTDPLCRGLGARRGAQSCEQYRPRVYRCEATHRTEEGRPPPPPRRGSQRRRDPRPHQKDGSRDYL